VLPVRLDETHPEEPVPVVLQPGRLEQLHPGKPARVVRLQGRCVTTLQIGSYGGLDSSPYGIPSGNPIHDKPVYLVYYR